MSAVLKEGWSVMGTGTIAAEQMVAAIRAAEHSPLWVVSRSKQDAAHFAEDLGIPGSTTNLDKVLRDTAVGFAYVSARIERRGHYISASAKGGKHILCDGPIAETSRSAAALVRLCEQAAVRLAVNQPFRASAIHQAMQRLVVGGEIGRVQSVVLLRGGPYRPLPTRRRGAAEDRGPIHIDLGVDDVDLVRFLTGAEPAEVLAASVAQGEPVDHIAYTLRMSDGALVQVHESFRTADIDSLVMVAGDKAVLTANGTLNGRGSGTLVRRSGGRSELMPVRDREKHLSTIESFLASLREDPSWLSQGAENVVALRVAESVALAARRGRPVPIPS